MKIGCWEVPKPSYPPLLWLAEWKVPAPLMNWNDNCNDVDFNLNFDFCWRRCLRYSDKLCVAVPAIRKMRTSEGCFVQTNEHLKWKKRENGHFITFKKVGKWAFDMRAPLNLAAMSRFSISWNPFIWECCKGSTFGRKQKRRICYSRCKETPLCHWKT